MIAALVLAVCSLPVAAPAASCVRQVPVVGRACSVANGFEIELADGTRLFTHGPDPAPSVGVSATLAPAPVSCVRDPAVQPHGLGVYYRTSDAADLYATRLPDIQTQIETANAKVLEEASLFGLDIRFRMACSGTRPAVVKVNGTVTRSQTSFDTIITDLRAQGYADTQQKYWIWVEGPHALGSAAGIGTIWDDDANVAWNSNNVGPSYAATFGYTNAEGGWSIMLHEASHNLGAVQNTSPFSSGGFHCNDGRDIMCYADGGSKSFYSTSRCPTATRFDCGNNDYFNPRPEPGSYPARAWNLAAPINRFMAGCAYEAARLLPTQQMTVDVTACAGRPFAASGALPPRDLGALPRNVDAVGEPPSGTDVDVCFFAGTTSLGCAATRDAAERGIVPAGATRAVVTTGMSAVVDAVFSTI